MMPALDCPALLVQSDGPGPSAVSAASPAAATLLSIPGWAPEMGRTVRHIAPPALIIAAVLGAWEAAGRFAGLPGYILPAPSHIVAAFAANTGLFARHVPITAFEALIGFIVGNAFAILLAITFVHSRTIERGVYPMAVALR